MQNNNKDTEIYFFYLGEKIFIGKKYHSPFHKDVDTPSLCFKYINNIVQWTDFGGIEMNPDIRGTRDGLAFIMQMEGLKSRYKAEHFYATNIKGKVGKDFAIQIQEKKEPILKIRTVWEDFEWEYWNFIDRSLLRPNLIFPNELYDSGFLQIKSAPGNPSFVFLFSSKEGSWKLYTPNDKLNKFKSHNVRGVVEGWDQLPASGQNLIISKGTKDRLVNLTYLNASSINPHSENAYNSLINKSHEINARFKNIFVSLDADRTGQMQTKKMCDKTGWTPIYKPLWYKDLDMKDESDIVINYGSGAFLEVCRKLKLPIK